MKKLFTTFCILAMISFSMKAEVELATFEDPEIDFFETTGYNNNSNGSLEVVANPLQSGINTTSQCLRDNRKAGVDWSSAIGKLYSSVTDYVEVTDENQYLHIMVYSDVTTAGMLLIRSGATDEPWDYQGEKPTDIRFNFKAGEWTDLVIPVKEKGIAAVYGFYFMSQDWSAPSSDRNFYYDEIIINDSSFPRGDVNMGAGMVADFEEGGITPAYTNSGSACASMTVVDNDDNEGLNKTLKTLYAETATSGASWWGGAEMIFKTPFYVNEDNQYLHMYLKTNLAKIEVVLYGDAEKWNGSVTPQQDGWYDYVVDLSSLSGQLLTGFRVAFDAETMAVNQGKTLYIDEVILNDSSMPRMEEEPEPEPEPNRGAGIAADFEEDGKTPTFTNSGNACASMTVVDNDDNEGLNKTSKTLYAETATSGASWWGGAELTFDTTFQITVDNQYLHMLLKTDLPEITLVLYFDDDEWLDAVTTQQNEWYDYVVDLSEFSEKILKGFRIAFDAENDVENQGKSLYIDEVILNDSSMPRIDENEPSSVNATQDQSYTIVNTENGIMVKDVTSKVTVYDLTGKMIYQGYCEEYLEIELPEGLYVIALDNAKQKVLVY